MKRLAAILLFLFLLPCAAQAANRFGICATSCTWDGASTAMWSATSGGATGASVPVAADNVTFDTNTCVGGTTCTITVNTNFTVNQITWTCTASTTGCILDFSVNNNSVTSHIAISDGAVSGTRTLKMGSGTFTLDNACAGCSIWIMTGTGTVIQAGTSTISIIGSTNNTGGWSFQGGTNTYNIVNVSASNGGPFNITSGGGAGTTFNQFIIAGKNALFINGAIIVNTAFTVNGTAANPVDVDSFSRTTQVTINGAGAFTATWAGIRDIKVNNGGGVATNSMMFPNNAGINAGGGGSCILGGWLLWRDLPQHLNDNFPAWIEKAA